MKLSKRILSSAVLALISAATARGQCTEIGGMVGGGAFTVSSGSASGGLHAGADGCFFCAGRTGLFIEYSHFHSAESGGYSDRVRSADTFAGGVRIQWFDRTRVFLDVGFAGSSDKHFGGGGGWIGGVVVAGGVLVPLAEHWYIRPQVRVYGLSPHSIEGLSMHWALNVGVGIGYRF